ncbi:MAG: EF-hand domain-containing protein [Planctomycetota bacterium]
MTRLLLALVLCMGVSVALAQDEAPKKKGGKAPTEEQFQKMDKDKDGFLSKDELGGAKGDTERAEKILKAKDKDGDGKLSKEEFLATGKGGKKKEKEKEAE